MIPQRRQDFGQPQQQIPGMGFQMPSQVDHYMQAMQVAPAPQPEQQLPTRSVLEGRREQEQGNGESIRRLIEQLRNGRPGY